MKKIVMLSLAVVGFVGMSAVASASPFVAFEGTYEVVDSSCGQDGRVMDCELDATRVTVIDGMLGREAIIEFKPGLSYTMVAYSHSMEHEMGWARFSGDTNHAVWTMERSFGDEGPLMTRTGMRIEMMPVAGRLGNAVLTITDYKTKGSFEDERREETTQRFTLVPLAVID